MKRDEIFFDEVLIDGQEVRLPFRFAKAFKEFQIDEEFADGVIGSIFQSFKKRVNPSDFLI